MSMSKIQESFNIKLALALSVAFLFLHTIFLVSIPGFGQGTVTQIHWSKDLFFPAPFEISRWADLLVGVIYAFLVAFALTSKYMSKHHAPVGFTLGLIPGTVVSVIITLIIRIFALPHLAFIVSLFGGALVALVSILATFAAYDPGRGMFFIPSVIFASLAGTLFGNGFIFGFIDGIFLAIPFILAGVAMGVLSWVAFLFVHHKVPTDRYPTGPLYK